MTALFLLAAALNLNPTFDAASDALPGWTLVGAARHIRDAAGVLHVLTEEGSAKGDLFPVAPGKRIEVTLKACGPKYSTKKGKVWAAVAFFATPEEAKAKGAQWKFARPKLEIASAGVSERRETYPVPTDAKWCRVTVRGGSVYTCEAREVGK